MLGVVVLGLIISTALVLVSVLAAVSIRIETETAADAAALAAVGAAVEGRQPHAAAAEAAAANGARLGTCRCPSFEGRSFFATVVVTRDIRLPVFGDRRIRVARTAEYSVDT